MNSNSNVGEHKNDDKKTMDLSAELKATTARRRQRVSQGPGEPRAHRRAPMGNRRIGQPYSQEVKEERLFSRKTPIRRVPISRVNQCNGNRRVPRSNAGNRSRNPKTEFIKLGSLNSSIHSSESDKVEQQAPRSNQLEPMSGSTQPVGNTSQIDSDYAFAMQLEMTERGDQQHFTPGRNIPSNAYKPSTSVNVQFFSNDMGIGQNNSVSMVHSRNADDGMSTTIRVNQGGRSNSAPALPTQPVSSQILGDAELARRIMESDIQDSEDDHDGPVLNPVHDFPVLNPVHDFPINTNHRFNTDEALARHIQEEEWHTDRPVMQRLDIEDRDNIRHSLPAFPASWFHMDEDDDISDWSEEFPVSGFLQHPGIRGVGNRFRHHPGGNLQGLFGPPDERYHRPRSIFRHMNLDTMDHDELLQLQEEIGHVSRGAQQSTINELPTRKFVQKPKPIEEKTMDTDSKESENNMASCCICMEAFKTAEDVRTLPCLHIYHTKCIDKWLVRNRTCPICKFDITMA